MPTSILISWSRKGSRTTRNSKKRSIKWKNSFRRSNRKVRPMLWTSESKRLWLLSFRIRTSQRFGKKLKGWFKIKRLRSLRTSHSKSMVAHDVQLKLKPSIIMHLVTQAGLGKKARKVPLLLCLRHEHEINRLKYQKFTSSSFTATSRPCRVYVTRSRGWLKHSRWYLKT